MTSVSGALEQLKEQTLSCRRCGLCEGRTHVVFGTGQPDAGILLVGEGPGEQEDLRGEPFVGRSGQLMDKMLEYAGFSRERNLYIANMVKCRPPKNRDPRPEEVGACIGWLREQTRLIRPKILVCIGRIAATYIIDKGFRVTTQHGEFFERGDMLMMGTFHPAALLRNPANKPQALDDFLALRKKADELGLP